MYHFSFVAEALFCQPVFRWGFKVGITCAACTAMIKYLSIEGILGPQGVSHLLDPSAFSSLTLLISLFIAFRASQAYTRFWSGTQSFFVISADFFDVASSLVAFSRNATAPAEQVAQFRQVVVRLFSLLHALILADLESEGHVTGEEEAFKYELIDVSGIDHASMEELKRAGNRQVDLVFQWLQSLIVEGQQSGVLVVPPPILSRVFQELNAGIMEYHKTLSLAEIPFPVPYTASTQVVLILHWLLTPIMACNWSSHVWSAALIAFVQVFMLWSLNGIAQELENPFGGDKNDLDTHGYHSELNERLIFLLGTAKQAVPTLSPGADLDPESLKIVGSKSRYSLKAWWSECDTKDTEDLLHDAISIASVCAPSESQYRFNAQREPNPATPVSSSLTTFSCASSKEIMVEQQPVSSERHRDVRRDAHQTGNRHSNDSAPTGGFTTPAILPSNPSLPDDVFKTSGMDAACCHSSLAIFEDDGVARV